jgi:GYF domain 2
MSQLWFYGKLGSKIGPYTALQLRDLAVAGKILVTDTVWKDGIDLGVLANRVKNLFPIPALVPLLKEIIVPLVTPEVENSLSPEIFAPKTAIVALAELATAAAAASSVPAPKPALQPSDLKKIVKKLRALAIRGAKITGQDGVTMQIRKICTTCGHEDPARISMAIRIGKTRIIFYCPKCRKARDVEIQGLN